VQTRISWQATDSLSRDSLHAEAWRLIDRPDPDARPAANPNLPHQLTRFVGRRAELAQLRSLIGSNRLVTLTGAGGCGKTRLGLELATKMRAAFPDGVWWVEFGSLTDAGFAAQRIAALLGVPETIHESLLEALVGRTAPMHMLLVLDNCEHLVDDCALIAETLVTRSQYLHILATSREALNVPGELVWRVPSLRLPDAGDGTSPEALSTSEAVALFIDRAREVRPHFELTQGNAAAVADICRRLDGIPLALELAAARIQVLNAEQVLGRLNDRFRLLTGGRRTALPRQQTLRASIEWSCSLLTAKEQTLFRRLSVFAGTFGVDTVERICADEAITAAECVSLVARLADKSVVQSENEYSGVSSFRMLESIKQYAHERLVDAGEAELIERRYVDYYERLSGAADAALTGPGQATWLERLDAEHDNLRATLAWSVDRRPESALRLSAALSGFWRERAHFTEGRMWLQRAIDAADANSPGRARALEGAAWLAYGQADYIAARSYCDRGLTAARQTDDAAGAGAALVGLGAITFAEGDAAGARALLEEGLRVAREVGPPRNLVRALSQLATLEAQQGAPDEAACLADESLALARQTADLFGTVVSLHNLAMVAVLRGDTAAQRSVTEEGLIASRNLRSPWWMSVFLEHSAVAALAQGHHETAIQLAAAAAHLRESVRGVVSPVWVAVVEQFVLAPARDAVGETAAAAAWASGTRMPIDQVVGSALNQAAGTLADSDAGRRKVNPLSLSKREQAVAALVAEGRTNKQIAAGLFISKRTVETHIQHIFNKLGVESRASIAAWAVGQRLVTLGRTAPPDAVV